MSVDKQSRVTKYELNKQITKERTEGKAANHRGLPYFAVCNEPSCPNFLGKNKDAHYAWV